MFLTTLNRTLFSFAGAIVAWEYALRRLPIGTHNWDKFLTPQELQAMLSNCKMGWDLIVFGVDTLYTLICSGGFSTRLIHGMCYNPISNNWSWTSSTAINFCIHAVKDSE